MTQHPSAEAVDAELGRLVAEFFRTVSFEEGGAPDYEQIHSLFVEQGLLIKNVSPEPVPEISTLQSFIEPRQAMVRQGELTRFLEEELSGVTQMFGNVAQRFSAYSKGGTMNGKSFTARGMVCTQFILTPMGWRISAMAWDDERPGLSLPAG